MTVRKLGRDKYQLISGERRFRASQLAGLEEVPCYIRIANDQTMLEMALVENIQREDLNAIEVGLSYQRLIDECDLTQEKLSQKLKRINKKVRNFTFKSLYFSISRVFAFESPSSMEIYKYQLFFLKYSLLIESIVLPIPFSSFKVGRTTLIFRLNHSRKKGYIQKD